jgi:hypothetical protein
MDIEGQIATSTNLLSDLQSNMSNVQMALAGTMERLGVLVVRPN